MQKVRQISIKLALTFKVFILFVLVFLTSFTVYTYTRARMGEQTKAYAATSSNLNFQGRLLKANGGIVPDGFYNLEFKIYDGGTNGGPAGTGDPNAGTLLWTETRSFSGPDNRVRVVNGYFSVSLGSLTAFPGSINWDQELWMTMNVGGSTTTPTWDGEMFAPTNKRTKLTATPYSFRAGSAKTLLDNQGSFTGALSFLALTNNRTVNLSDKSGTVLLDSTGFANGGNTFAGLAVLGTTDTFGLNIITDNTVRGGFDTSNNLTFGNGGSAGTAIAPNAFILRGTGSSTAGTAGAGLSVIGGAGATTTTGSAGGGLNLLGGNAGGTGNNNGGNLNIDGGTATGTGISGIINVASTNASALNLGRVGNTTSVLGTFTVAGGTNFGVYYRDATGNLSTTGTGTSGQCLIGSTGAAPLWGGCSGVVVTLQNSYTNSSNPEVVLDSTRGALTLRDNATPIGTNLLEVQNNSGATTYFGVSATGTTISGGLTQSGGTFSLTGNGASTLSTTAGNLTIQAGSGTVSFGSTTSLTSTGALSLAPTSTLTLDSGSNTVNIAATDTTLQRTAAGAYTIDLNDAGATTLNLNNSGAGAASLNLVDGNLSVAGTTILTNARALQNLTGLTVSSGGFNVTGNSTLSGTLTGLTGLTVASGGASISGGINNNNSGLTNVGSLAGVTTVSASGLITGTSGLTISGANVSLNDNSNFNTSINTVTSTGTVTIGGGFSPFTLNSTAFDVSTAGALSGITTISASGVITGATATNTINGLVINTGSLSSITGYSQTSGNFSQTGTGTFSTGTGAVSLNGPTTITNSTNSTTSLVVNGTTGTAATAATITQTGNASNLSLTNSAITSGALVSLTHTNSAFTGTGLLMNIASGSGSFASGNFADFQVNGVSRFKVDNSGALQVTTDSANGINVQSTSGVSYFRVDVTGTSVRIGSATADATGVLLVLDTKNTAADPTGINGGSYYNSSSNKFRCYQNGLWQDCLPAAHANVTFAADQDTWTNMPAADTEYFNTRTRAWFDLTDAREFRLVIGMAVAGFAGADCRLQYAASDAGPFTNLDGGLGPELPVDSIASQKTAWATINSAARADVVLRVMCKDGNGTIDPQFRGVRVEIR